MKRAISIALLLIAGACAQQQERPTLDLVPTSFEKLKGWNEDDQAEALSSFLRSCEAIQKQSGSQSLALKQAGTIEDWKRVCKKAGDQNKIDTDNARAYFEKNFVPYVFTNEAEGLFTGYYEPQLRGAWQRRGKYQTPIYAPPNDMLTIDLGEFRESLKGQKITGKIDGRKFVPYDNREAVAGGSLSNRAKPLLWVDSPVDAFFLEIQGSGQVVMEDGSIVRVGYAAQNGHGYTPVGRVLASLGEIEKPVTMQKIRSWFAAHPDQRQSIMNENPSVVFFKQSDKSGAVGAQGVVLTPLRSMAVDPSFVPLGTPLWVETGAHKCLVVAQDTGGAIKGAVRGDLFWGSGPSAESGAGSMQETGSYVLLLPRESE